MEESRGRQMLVGGVILGVLTVVAVALLLTRRMIPGLVGECVDFVVGVMSSPFFMEGSFALIGLMVVIGLNTWRRRREGEELVYLDELERRDEGGE